jgi:hypothetical protein
MPIRLSPKRLFEKIKGGQIAALGASRMQISRLIQPQKTQQANKGTIQFVRMSHV